MDRRSFLRLSVVGAATAALGPRLIGSSLPLAHAAAAGPYGSLLPADARGIALPAGFTSRVVATSGETVPGTSYVWHGAPDGGATFATSDGGWIYASNSELGSGGGGVGVLRFDASGTVVAAQRVLGGTSRNCAGGPTPWGTWLSCEETSTGQVWETDPLGVGAPVARPAMGRFNHEAAACDPVRRCVYLTEDASSGRLWRFTPTVWGDLSAGVLEVATVTNGTVAWGPTSGGHTAFDGGEGAWYANDKLWFTTKGDNRVWEVDLASSPQRIRVIYDDTTSPNPVLTGVDNIVGSVSGDLFVAEDGGNMEIVMIEPSGAVSVFLQVAGQSGSELAGPAFSPDGQRLYFSSQRGGSGTGITYEVRGPFRTSSTGSGTTTTTTSTTTTSTTTTSTTTTTKKPRGPKQRGSKPRR